MDGTYATAHTTTGGTMPVEFVDPTTLTVGTRIAGGGVVTAVRTSRSGLTVYVTVVTATHPNGYEFPQSAAAKIATFI